MSKWPTVRLGDIAKIVSGGTPSRGNPAFWGGRIPWVKTTEIRDGRIEAADIRERITEAGLKGSSARVIPAGTILLAMYGQGSTRGRVSILNADAATNQACAAFLLGDGIDRDFVFQVLRSQYSRIRRLSNVGGQDNLSADLLRSIPIPLPSLSDQKRIAGILATWDIAVEKAERLVELKRMRSTGLERHLIRGVRLDWPHERFDTVFKVVSERSTEALPLLSVTQDRGAIPRSETTRRVAASDASVASYKRIRPGEFAVSLRSFEGGIEYSEWDGLISAAYTVLRPSSGVTPSFYRHFFKSDVFVRHYLAESVVGIRDGKQIDMPGMLTTRIPVPDVADQSRVAEILDLALEDIRLQRCLRDSVIRGRRAAAAALLDEETG